MRTDQAQITDLYQLTMAQSYWHSGRIGLHSSFYLHFRENPFRGGYAIACGMAQAASYVDGFRFTDDDIAYLRTLEGHAAPGASLFAPEFLDYLALLRLKVDIDSVAEGTAVFPHEPLMRVTGPILQCQLLETALLNMVGFETLVATKAARICAVAPGPVAEFGLRRAQGPAGGVFASRAAIVGGCASTSNVEAGRRFGLPVSGTHSHSWVMAYDDELEAFRAFAAAFPHDCVLLVDTYDTLKGVANAIVVAQELRDKGSRLLGIRIDSGDLAWLSKEARRMLDAAGHHDVKIVASNDLDEYTVSSLVGEQGACIDSWGVGTRLATAFDQPALGCVYKMSATSNDCGASWTPRIKVSEQVQKSTLPGVLSVRRYVSESGVMVGDMVYDLTRPPADDRIIDPTDELRQKDLSGATSHELLQPLVRAGCAVGALPSALEAQAQTQRSLAQLDASNKRLLNPHSYPVGLERGLLNERDRLIRAFRGL
ncbi:MAG: nicotinate phosphoribosyltransferase [Coriobacteriales bacterium]|jgi:nicotinate phosphoribosyltransferase|nr:nicotinate phosphoribosyltransferase [Coriobacteriales bacterium]